jgi:pilus assembly protein Flp/PilA
MTAAGVLNWVVVAVGVALVLTGVNAILYFRRQEQLMGSNWILHAFYRTAFVITSVAAILVIMRAVVLLFGASWWTSVIQSAAIVWLLLKPLRLRRLFEQHEGRDEPVRSTSFIDKLRNYLDREERGQTLVEYGLLIALIAVVVIAALLFLGPVVANLFNDIGNTIQSAPPAP